MSKALDMRILQMRDDITALKTRLNNQERAEQLAAHNLSRARQSKATDARIEERLARINGKATHRAGDCAECGKPHGTIIVKRYAGDEKQVCPITYYISRMIERWHLGQSAQPFIKQHPMGEFLCYCNGKTED